MSESSINPPVQGQMFLFQKPELVNKERHEKFGVSQPAKRFGFCANVRAVPLTVSEIPAAMKDYPVVFAGPDQMLPIAVTGLVDDVNLFVDEKGDWEANRYVPGYIRRYPFGVANETGSDRFAIVIDTAFEGMNSGGENPLFVNGEASDMVKQAIDFCKTYEEDRHRTNEFGRLVNETGIAKGQSAQFTPQGETEPRPFAQYLGIDEEALKQLPGEKLAELRDNGVLPLIYAMLISMGNWRMLLQRRALRYGVSDGEIMTPQIN